VLPIQWSLIDPSRSDKVTQKDVIAAAVDSLDAQQCTTLRVLLEAEASLPAETFELLRKYATQQEFRLDPGLVEMFVRGGSKTDVLLAGSRIAKNLTPRDV
jgi:hypothetical protein